MVKIKCLYSTEEELQALLEFCKPKITKWKRIDGTNVRNKVYIYLDL